MEKLLHRVARPALRLLLLVASSVFLLGMGAGDENAAVGLPLPEKNFAVSMTDRSGLQTQSSKLTWEGKVLFRGKYGEATVNVPFAKIQRAEFRPTSAGDAPYSVATITLHSGQQIELALENETSVYAETPFGELEISVADLRLLEFSE